MKSVLAFIVVISSSAILLAYDLPEFNGVYAFSQTDLQMQQIQHQVRLVTSSPQGQELLQSYRKQNYACVFVSASVYQCKSFLKNLLENPEVREQIITKFQSTDFRFSASQSDYNLVNEGEIIQEFEKSQKSNFAGQDFEKIHLYVTADLKKFKVFNYNAQAEHFYLNSNQDIAKQVQITAVNKKSSSVVVEDKYTYLYEAVWK